MLLRPPRCYCYCYYDHNHEYYSLAHTSPPRYFRYDHQTNFLFAQGAPQQYYVTGQSPLSLLNKVTVPTSARLADAGAALQGQQGALEPGVYVEDDAAAAAATTSTSTTSSPLSCRCCSC